MKRTLSWEIALPIVLTVSVLVSLVPRHSTQFRTEKTLDDLATQRLTTASFIVRARSNEQAAAAIRDSGGTVSHELGIIDSAAGDLAPLMLARLTEDPRVLEISGNPQAEVAGSSIPYTEYPRLAQADRLHSEGITGRGVTLAVVDTGLYGSGSLIFNTDWRLRVLAHYDAIADEMLDETSSSDDSGHGGHVAAIAVNSKLQKGERKYNGLAPDADLIAIKAFGSDGRGTYADVIRGLGFVLDYKDAYGIRVVNLSFSAPPRSHYWDDPLNQAVMRLWQEGIVVVTAAGNGGPSPMTIGVPGNVPYVITVGAASDANTVQDPGDDFLASFSAAGPSPEGFIKPELVAPGGHMISLMGSNTEIATTHGEYGLGAHYFVMSGTSQAAAVVSGVVALMLQANPTLSPDDVKCRLLAGARPAVNTDGSLAYTPFQQGAGLVDAYSAVHGTRTGCANGGLDVDLDLQGTEHYFGPARLDSSGNFVLHGQGYAWDGAYRGDGFSWDGGSPWNDAVAWSDGNPWIDAGLWSTGNPWIDVGGNPWIDIGGTPWIDIDWWDSEPVFSSGLTESASINLWVEQE